MSVAIVGLVTVSLLIVVAAALGVIALILSRRRRGSAPDDLSRVGSPDGADPRDAALRATGTSAWMRPGGGGGV